MLKRKSDWACSFCMKIFKKSPIIMLNKVIFYVELDMHYLKNKIQKL